MKQSSLHYGNLLGDFRKKDKVLINTDLTRRLDLITNRLIEQAVLYRPETAQWGWKVTVIDDIKTINAFCMPGGLMAIYTGLAEGLHATDDEIAQVMGHEIGHALANHGAEKMSMQVASSIAVLAVSAAVSSNSRQFQSNQALFTVSALAFVNLPNSRTAETEADRIGIELAARAGYKPEAAVSLWQKMMVANKKKGGSDFWRTHPASERRIEFLQGLAPPMQLLYATASSGGRPPFDWLNGDKTRRPVMDGRQPLAFYSESWDAFSKGRSELGAGSALAFTFVQGKLSKLFSEKNWRDLARETLDADFRIDLAYFYLGKAAAGLGFKDAAKNYLDKASGLAGIPDSSCAKHMMVSCSGIDVMNASLLP
ncbi:M48 family metallopeptidase [Polaromonas eurypsychrophila]|uniref:Peptidase M48 domain-containing protein n=2 Tax=Polaromonas eurypsychrophila TaxID=1614635 RepID=A0A916SLK7_9BURK|nr:hypothetical protein GCM10011496_29130 [Polaromonas eurypsychrophila]